jgi:hypothetical protein
MKTCPKEEILQAYWDGELAGEAGAAVRTHLATCVPCAATIEKMELAFAVLGNAFTAELPEDIPTARLRARIESALAEQAAPKFAWATWFWRLSWATALLLLVGFVGWAWLRRQASPPPQQADYKKPAPAVTPESSVPLKSVQPELVQHTPRPRQQVRHRSRHNIAEVTEAVTEFYPLREGEDLTALETLQLVRVELPSSALSEVGLPVALEAAQTRIKADVALGEDGLARAIRFVR